MANVKISQFQRTNIVNDADDLTILQNGINKIVKSPVLESKILEKAKEYIINSGVGFGGFIDLETPSSELKNAYFFPTESGIYSNYGNIEVDLSNGFYIIYKKESIYESFFIPVQLGTEVNTIDDLRLKIGNEGDVVTLLGYYEKGDKEPLNYKYTTEQGVDDGGSVINTSNGSWQAVFSDKKINARHFGVKYDGITDNTNFIQNIINYNAYAIIDSDNCLVKGTITIQKNTGVIGTCVSNAKWTEGGSVIKHFPENPNTDLFISGNIQIGYGYLAGLEVSNLTIRGNENSRYALNLYSVANSVFNNLYIDTFKEGIHADYLMNVSFKLLNIAETETCVRFVNGISTTCVFDECYLHFSDWACILEHETSLGVVFRNSIFESCTEGGIDIYTDNVVDFVSLYTENIPRVQTGNVPIVQIGVNGVEKNLGYPTAKVSFFSGNIAGCNFGIDEESIIIRTDKLAYLSFFGTSFNRAHDLIENTNNSKLISFNDISLFQITEFQTASNRNNISFNGVNHLNIPYNYSEAKRFNLLGTSKWSFRDEFVLTDSDMVLRKDGVASYLINNKNSLYFGSNLKTTGNATNVFRIEKTNGDFTGATYNDSSYLYSKTDSNGLVHLMSRDSAGLEYIIDGVISLTTVQRPLYNYKGRQIFDATLNKPIWWDGTNWIDASGTVV